MTLIVPGYGRQVAARRSRALFHWRASDLSLTPLTGQVPTFARAFPGTYVDALGRVAIAPPGVPRFEYYDLDGDGILETPALLIEGAGENLCFQSEDFGTTWSVVGTPTRVAAAKRCGSVVLDRIGDDAAGATEYYFRTVTFPADGLASVLVHLAPDAGGPSAVRIFDNSVGARLEARISWSVAGVPTVTMITGVLVRTRPLSDGTYRFEFQTTAVVAANTNVVQVFPADISSTAAVNTVYAGGVAVFGSAIPSSYSKTTTAAVTRLADAATWATLFGLQDLTAYLRIIRPVWADMSGTINSAAGGLLQMGAAGGEVNLYAANTVRDIGWEEDTAGTDAQVAGQALPSGSTIELAASLATPLTGGVLRLDVGAGYGSASVVASALAALAAQVLGLGGGINNFQRYGISVLEAKVAAGSGLPLAQMRELF